MPSIINTSVADTIAADQHLPVCATCGAQWSSNEEPPKSCPICLDERQYVPEGGTVWTSLNKLKLSGRHNVFLKDKNDEDITFLVTVPHTGIGQCPKLMKTGSGYLLIECMSFVDEDTINRILDLVAADGRPFLGIAISHPHWYNTASTWSKALGSCPIFCHALDKQWWTRRETVEQVTWWEGATLKIGEHATMILCGGHFDGGACVTHVDRGEKKGGWLAAADIAMITTSSERRQVSFMYSYPNYIPLPPNEVVLLWNRLKPFQFCDAYCAWPERRFIGGAKESIFESVEKQLKKEGVENPVELFSLTLN